MQEGRSETGRRGAYVPGRARFGAILAAFLGVTAIPVASIANADPLPPSPEGPGCIARSFGPIAPGLRGALSHPADGTVARHPAASTGSIHALVVLAEFEDLPHRISPARFVEHLFGGFESLRGWYEDVSGGQLHLSGDVVGWVSLPESQWFYSQGAGGVGAYPNNGQRLAEDAVAAAVAAGTDLSPYDSDGDGIVDVLLIVHSGQGLEWSGGSSANTSDPDPLAINSHKWSVTAGDFGSGFPEVVDYFTCPELQLVNPDRYPAWTDSIATIGVYAHELGHVLGLPDFYDTITFASRVGIWATMDFGSWASLTGQAPGATPSHFSAWSKLFLGWTSPVELVPGAGAVLDETITLTSATRGGAPLQVLPNPGGIDWGTGALGTGEYFLAEVRTREGWDSALPSEGLLLYQIDESSSSNRASDHPDQGGIVVLVPQDGTWSVSPPSATVGDPWPGALDEIGPETHPSTARHDGTPTGVTLSSIGPVSDAQVVLDAYVPNLTIELPLPVAAPNPFFPGIHDEVSLIWSLASPPPPGATATLFDLRGRRVRRLPTSLEGGLEGRAARWDGRDEAGDPVVPGVYFFRIEGEGARGAGRVILLR